MKKIGRGKNKGEAKTRERGNREWVSFTETIPLHTRRSQPVDGRLCHWSSVVPLKIISDHLRAIVYLISDRVVPSNIGIWYIVRRLIRRVIRIGKKCHVQLALLEDESGK
ncbi:hypothetical protein LguiB_025991 [Lonicera macranthoides]